MKRALIITPVPTHPIDAGNRARIAQLAEMLRARGVVLDCFYYAIDGLDPVSLEAMRPHWETIFVAGARGYERQGGHSDHWLIDDWIAPQPLALARRLAATRRYDLVIANYVWCSALLEPFRSPGTCLLLDTHDVFSERHVLLTQASVDAHWFYTSEAEEARGCARADLVLAIQAEEGALLRSRLAVEVEVLEFAPAPRDVPWPHEGPIRVGFFGSENPLNVGSVERFDALLREQRDLADLRRTFDFRLYGGVSGRLAHTRIWRRMGRVAEPDEVYRQIDIAINPMIGGTGLKIKTVEALAYGRPILTTISGGAGLADLHSDLALADEEALLVRLRALATRPAIRTLAGEMAEAYAALHHRTVTKMAALAARLGLDDASIPPS